MEMVDGEYVIKCLKYLHDRETWKEGPLVWDDRAADRRRITADALALLKQYEELWKRLKYSVIDAQMSAPADDEKTYEVFKRIVEWMDREEKRL